jgi:hypothetical protein
MKKFRKSVREQNVWYDELAETDPVLRFNLFILPLLTSMLADIYISIMLDITSNYAFFSTGCLMGIWRWIGWRDRS